MVMSRKQVLVQLNEELLESLDRAMQKSGQTRSQLVRAAISDYLERFLKDDIDRQYVEAYTRRPVDDEFDALAAHGAQTVMRELDEQDGGW
jgi:metal-responsive CopG/Arc/MetJ family transcriptional regulator